MPTIDVAEHREVHGNRFLRMLGMANDIARFLNIEAKAKKAFEWLTSAVKDTLFGVWKSLAAELTLVSKRVSNILGFGSGEEPPADSIVLEPEYIDELILPVF